MHILKKNEFRGMLCLLFDTCAIRNRVVETISKAKIIMLSSKIWVAPDLPLPMRAEKKFRFELKRLVLSWS